MTDRIKNLVKVNKHLSIALSVLNNDLGLYLGTIRDVRELVKLKLKLEHLIDSTTRQEVLAKKRFFNKLK